MTQTRRLQGLRMPVRLTDRISLVLACGVLDLLVHAGSQNQWATGAVRSHRARSNQTESDLYPCNETLMVRAHDSGYLQLPEMSPGSSRHYCQIIIGTQRHGFRIRFTFNHTSSATSSRRLNVTCDDEYVHVGNSRYAVDIKSMTSYKFCEQVKPQEVVSREGKLWLIYSSHGAGVFTGMRIKFEVLPRVTCDTTGNTTYFRCSPVECIPYALLCDGTVHCSNGRDEYCDHITIVTDQTLKPSPATSSQPHHTVSDVCLTMRSKSSELYDCPSGWSRGMTSQRGASREWLSGSNVSAVLWRRLTCDTILHCHGGEDEDELLCAPKQNTNGLLRPKIYIPAIAVVVFAVGITLIYHRDKCRRIFQRSASNDKQRGGQCERTEKSQCAVGIEDVSEESSRTGKGANNTKATHGEDTIYTHHVLGAAEQKEQHPNYFILSQTAV